jgi:hypothetical protein
MASAAVLNEPVDKAAISFTEHVKFHEKQAAAYWAMFARPQATVLAGGSGYGGKSYLLRAAAIGFHIWAVTQGIDAPVTLFTSSSYEALRDRHFTYFVKEWGHLGQLKSSHVEYGRCFLFNDPKLGAICFRNISDQSERRGAEYLAGFNDETTEITSKLWGEFLYRVRAPGLDVNPVLAATNPDGVGHGWCKALWRPHLTKRLWLDHILAGKDGVPDGIPEFASHLHAATSGLESADYIYIPFLPDDNPMFDEKVFYRGVGHLPEAIQKARRYGNWDSPEGARWDFLDESTHLYKAEKLFPKGIPENWQRWMGTDYGLRVPYCNLWMAINPTGGDVYVYREDYRSRLTGDVQAVEIARLTGANEQIHRWKTDPAMFSSHPGHVLKPGEIKEVSAIDQYLAALDGDPRFPMPRPGKYKSREHALGRLDAFLNHSNNMPDIYFEEGCRFVWEELTGAVFEYGTVLKEMTNRIDPRCADHAITALYYGLAEDADDEPAYVDGAHLDPRKMAEGREAYYKQLDQERFDRDIAGLGGSGLEVRL